MSKACIAFKSNKVFTF